MNEIEFTFLYVKTTLTYDQFTKELNKFLAQHTQDYDWEAE